MAPWGRTPCQSLSILVNPCDAWPVNLILIDVHHPHRHVFGVLQQLRQGEPGRFHLLAGTAPIS